MYPKQLEGGAPGRNRTCDLELRRLLLYPTELRARGGRMRKEANYGKN